MSTETFEQLKGNSHELRRCLALLTEAIAQADRWYARREAELEAFDRRGRSRVDRLRAEHRIDASMAWHTA